MSGHSNKRRDFDRRTQQASAPYNFIPLNNTVITVNMEDLPTLDKFHQEKFNGYIELQLETKTPLFVKGVDSNFFSINDIPKIPGSSIRGMIRTLIEIVTYGKFHFCDDNTLYYRWIAERSYLRRYYRDKISDVKAGYLIYENNQFIIFPAEKKKGKSFSQIEIEIAPFTYKQQSDGRWIISSGLMPNKKRVWLINKPNKDIRLKISNNDINLYKNDKNRRIPIDLLESAKKGYLVRKEGEQIIIDRNIQFKYGVPIFYIQYKDHNDNERISFGHTRYFRIPYKYSIKDHIIPKKLIDENIIDFSEAIFGKENIMASRVFFEDASLIGEINNIFYKETSPRILASPKPTCFQHYLEQKNRLSELKHWDSKNIKIRGHKIFWHRKTPERGPNGWSEGRIIRDTQHITFKPIKSGVKFKAKIRFENLSDIELGALLFVLNLPNECYHKIGMGKPLGLGSIQIISRLFLINRIERYNSLFEEDKWNTGIYEERDINKFISSFENFIINQLTEEESSQSNRLWDTPRLKLLRKMLNWQNVKQIHWLEKTRYMDLEEFRARRILPKPDKV
ncbi:MAG: TIGR03986 family type III CRISPR-associated RAMP protein [Promethearchaeota archaeon]